MPGLRYYQTVAIGDAFGEEWERTFNSKAAGEGLSRISTTASDKRKGKGRAEEEEGETIAGPPYGGWLPFSRSTTTLKNDADEEDPFSDPSNRENGFEDDDGGVSEGIEYLSPTQRRVWRVLESMKENEGWNGTQYKLLERYVSSTLLSFPPLTSFSPHRNCNHFTQELVYRLTGRQAPGWINRASWVRFPSAPRLNPTPPTQSSAPPSSLLLELTLRFPPQIATSFPCVVPPGWVDEADEAAPSGENSVEINDSAHALSDSGHVRIEPPRADKMALRGRM